MAGSDLLRPDPGTGLAIVIMGVSGCGKSTVAAMLADALGCGFVAADDHHSQANKEKMSKGVPLTDADRAPWLESLRDAIADLLGRGEDVAVSCSALRLKYREVLREADDAYKPGTYEISEGHRPRRRGEHPGRRPTRSNTPPTPAADCRRVRRRRWVAGCSACVY